MANLWILLTAAAVWAPVQQPSASVRVTQKHLTALCLDGKALAPSERRWALPAGEHAMTVTMNNEPRPGIASADPGVAQIRFTIEPSHRYEIEVRASAASFSVRVWRSGEWTPVVRDRTDEKIVSSDPEWQAARPSTSARTPLRRCGGSPQVQMMGTR